MKRILIAAISLGVFLADSVRRMICLCMGRRIPAIGVVLCYHSITREKRSAFAKQMDELIRWSSPLCADTRTPLLPGARCAAVTFDDGFQSVVENALPELRQRRIPATLFIVTEALGSTPNWTSYSSDSNVDEPIMTEDQLQKLPSDLVQIGSHTRTHPMLPRLREEEARCELSRSRTRLEETIKREVKLFSFPYGAFNENLIVWCREEGYERIFTTLPHTAFSKATEFVVGRVWVDPDDWSLEFRLKLFGAYRWLPLAFALKRNVVSKMKAKVQEKAPAMTP